MLFLLIAVVATATQPAIRDFLAMESTAAGAAIPAGWIVRAVRGQDAPASSIVDSGGVRYLRIRGTSRAGWFVRELKTPIAPGSGTMEWSWRVPEPPRRADLRNEATDDAALRVFVVFERRGFWDRTPRTLFYSSGAVEPPGYERASFASSNLHVIRMSSAPKPDDWSRTVVDPFADYARVWGGAPRQIVAVGFLQDTEQTQSSALADVRSFHWRSGTSTDRNPQSFHSTERR